PPGRNQAEHLASGASGDSLHRMELWVAFAFGAAVGAFIGVLLGRYRATAAAGRLAAARAPAPPPPPVQHVVLDEGSANVLNALNNRLAAIRALADLLRESQPPRELRIGVTEGGPALVISLWDSGAPLSVEAEQRLVTPFRFTQSAGGGEIEFALARALAQSSGGTLRLRPRGGGGAEVVVTLSKSVLAPLARTLPAPPALPKLRILVVDDDAVKRPAMRLLLERDGHEVVAVENGLEAIERLGPASERFDAVVTDLQMPRLGGRPLY